MRGRRLPATLLREMLIRRHEAYQHGGGWSGVLVDLTDLNGGDFGKGDEFRCTGIGSWGFTAINRLKAEAKIAANAPPVALVG